MPCSDSSSSIAIRLDHEERFISFQFAKITCGREISAETEFSKYCKSKTIEEIINIPFSKTMVDLMVTMEEQQYVLYLEWDALRSALAQYVGLEGDEFDQDRCKITSIQYDEGGIEIAEVILPPKELPKIIPCSLSHQQLQQQ